MSTSEILIRGRNKQVLFDKFAKRKINVLNIKNIDEKCFIVTVDTKDTQKVFTICGNMWYNKLIKINGLQAVFAWFKRHFILCFGIIALFFVAFYFDNVLTEVEIEGVSVISESKVLDEIERCGVKKFTKFSAIDFDEVQNKVLDISDNFSYVTVQKFGNKLIVDVTESKEDCKLMDFSKKQITSTASGKVVSANVYRGKLLKNVGDYVEVGDVLIDGVFTFNEENFLTFAFGKVKIEVTYTYEYISNSDDDCSKAVALAKFYCGSDETELESVTVQPFCKGYAYNVSLIYYVECGG